MGLLLFGQRLAKFGQHLVKLQFMGLTLRIDGPDGQDVDDLCIFGAVQVGDQGVVLELGGRGPNPSQLAHVSLGDGAVVGYEVDLKDLALRSLC